MKNHHMNYGNSNYSFFSFKLFLCKFYLYKLVGQKKTFNVLNFENGIPILQSQRKKLGNTLLLTHLETHTMVFDFGESLDKSRS